MRIWTLSFLLAAVLSAGACSRDRSVSARDNPNQGDTVAEKVGRGAYKATQETKKAAKKAAKELKQAGHEAREGWNEAKQEARQNKK